ncbi:hypothetical protein Cni_G17803 [Canna indica]|uniref:Copper transporter n=1 Tax=Canna indica TaxID=4628 RepID=A0AAQ3KJU3_9LILI|nr:hypothetical protein Cni_G17803 [Canna indica]
MRALQSLWALFINAQFLIFGSGAGGSPVQEKTHPSSDSSPDIESPPMSENSRAKELAPAPAAPGSGSSLRSLTELLTPVTFCTGTYYSVPPVVQENYHDYPLYEPLLAVILLGILTSVVAIYHALKRNQHNHEAHAEAAIESEAEGENIKNKLLELGLIYSVVAIGLRILLQLNLISLLYVGGYFLIGGVTGALYLIYFMSPQLRKN